MPAAARAPRSFLAPRAEPPFARTLLTLLCVGLVYGLVEAFVVRGQPAPPGSAEALFTYVVFAGVWSTGAVALPMVLAWAVLRRERRLLAALARLVEEVRRGPDGRAAAAAVATVALVLAPLAIVAADRAARLIGARFADPDFQRWAVVLVTCGIAATAFVAAWPAQAATAAVLARVARAAPRPAWLVFALPGAVALAALVVGVRVLAADPELVAALPVRRFTGLAAIALGVAFFSWLAARVPARPRRLPMVTALLAFALAASLAPLRARTLDRAARAALDDGALLADAPVAAFARFADADRDGYARAFGGGDCNDGRADVHPGAPDLPGDGVDQDCSGSDARAVTFDFGPARAASLPAGARAHWNVLLITIDAVRADHVGAYGYTRHPTTPNIDALARESAVFEHCYSAGAESLRGFPAILSGVHPLGITWRGFGPGAVMDDKHTTIAETLHKAGYWTGYAHFNAYILNPGTEQGFDFKYGPEHLPPEARPTNAPRAAATTDAAIKVLAETVPADRPFFLWVQYNDPHTKYIEHPAYVSFGDGEADRYDQELAYVDENVARLLAAARKDPRWDTTLVVITSDHGEMFNEHPGPRGRYHGRELWEAGVTVPLVIRVPGAAPRRVGGLATNLDIAPTIYDLLELPPAVPRHGESLAGPLFGTEAISPSRVVGLVAYDEDRADPVRIGVARDHTKLVESVDRGLIACFDVAADPGERSDLGEHTPTCAALREQLDAFVVAVSSRAPAPAGAKKAAVRR